MLTSGTRKQLPLPIRGTLIRTFNHGDVLRVFKALWFLDRLYPRGDLWLERRLDACLHRVARCWIAETEGMLSGIAIETPKGSHRTKLSTLYVLPAFRRRRIATTLLEFLTSEWQQRELSEAVVTVPETREALLLPSLVAAGFSRIAVDRERYGAERDEAIYQWQNG